MNHSDEEIGVCTEIGLGKREEILETLSGDKRDALIFFDTDLPAQHFFNFCPDPQGQGSFLPAFSIDHSYFL